MNRSLQVYNKVTIQNQGIHMFLLISGHINKIIILMILIILFSTPVAGGIGNTSLCPPDPGTYWFGVHAPTQFHRTEMDISASSISSFAQAAGKKPAVVTFSHEWGINRSFPYQQFYEIHQSEAIPWVRLMLRSDIRQNRPEPLFTLSRILSGSYDSDLKEWAHNVKDLGYPVLIEYGTEVNGKWFPWNGYWTGNDHGAEKFKNTYRHIIRIMKDEGADNLIWVYHLNWHNNPDEPWNTAAAYYPGDEYVDIIAVSIYGALSPDATGVRMFSDMMNESYQELAALNPNKPIMIAETGTDIHNPTIDPVWWTHETYSSLHAGTWPQVIGVVWWNSAWPNDPYPTHNTSMRIEEDIRMIELFRIIVGSDDRYLNRTISKC